MIFDINKGTGNALDPKAKPVTYNYDNLMSGKDSGLVLSFKKRVKKPEVKREIKVFSNLTDSQATTLAVRAMRRNPKVATKIQFGYNGIFKELDREAYKMGYKVDFVKAYKRNGGENSRLAGLLAMLSSGALVIPGLEKSISVRANKKHTIRLLSKEDLRDKTVTKITSTSGLLNGKPFITSFSKEAIDSLEGHIRVGSVIASSGSLYDTLMQVYAPKYRGNIKQATDLYQESPVPACRLSGMSDSQVAVGLFKGELSDDDIKCSKLSSDRIKNIKSILKNLKDCDK